MSAGLDIAIDTVARPLDRARVLVIRALGPIGRTVVARRDVRVGVNGLLGVSVSLLLAVFFPFWTLALTPILLGVPHLLADVRYLVLRPGLHRRRALWGAWLGPIVAMAFGGSVAVGLAAMVGSAVAAEASVRRRVAVGLGATGLVAVAAVTEPWASLVVAHLHNVVAVGVWWAWRPRQRWWHALPTLAFGLAYSAVLAGVFDGLAVPLRAPGGQGIAAHVGWLAPGIPAPWGLRLVLAFALAQGVHYGVWLRLVPDEDRARESARTVRRTLLETVADCGWLTAVAAGLGLVFLGWAAWDVIGARDGYLAFARFHGSLEFAVVALWLAEGRRPA